MNSTRRSIGRALAVLALSLGSSVVLTAPALAGEGLRVIAKFGEHGSGPGQFSFSAKSSHAGSGVAVNSAGDVYVADTNNNRIEWFSSTGIYQGQFNGVEVDGIVAGAGKEAPAKLSEPEAIAVDNDPSSPSFGDVYVADPHEGVIDKFSASGEFLRQLPGDDTLYMAVDPSGDLWAAEYSNAFGDAKVYKYNDASENKRIGVVTLESEAYYIESFAVDSEQNLYTFFGGISKYGATGGDALGQVCFESEEACGHAVAVDPTDNDLLVDTRTAVAVYGPFGEPFKAPIMRSRSGILTHGGGLAVSPVSRDVYVADAGSNSIAILEHGATPEAPVTETASKLGGMSAVLHGELRPSSTKLEYYFEYNTGSSCTGGSITPTMEGEGAVSEEVTGLEPSEEYKVCLVSENNYGPSELGSPISFDTQAATPEVISESASTPIPEDSGVTLAAVLNPDHSGGETTYHFEYSKQAENGELVGNIGEVAGGSAIPAGEYGPREVSASESVVVGVKRTLYYRVVATNASGTSTGKVEAFTKLPMVDSESASSFTLTEEKLGAKLNPDFAATTYFFEYAPTEAALEKREGMQTASGNTEGHNNYFEELPAAGTANGLRPRTTYYYRLIAENESSQNTGNANEGKPVLGKIESFTTPSLPVVGTGEAQDITRTGALLGGNVETVGLPAEYYFQYVSEATYQTALAQGDNPFSLSESTSAPELPGSNEVNAIAPVAISGLSPQTLYHYRLVAKNAFGAEYGQALTFTTAGSTPPLLSTGAAGNISQTTATLSGTVDTNGLQTEYGFEIATSPSDLTQGQVPETGLGSLGGSTTETVSLALDELQPGTTYYYRLTATNADGTVKSEPVSFTTPGLPNLLSTPAPGTSQLPNPGLVFPSVSEQTGSTGTTTKALTKKQELTKALDACKQDKSKTKKVKCEKSAHAKYGTAKGKKKK
jgi:hypothetical protein